MLVRKSQEPFLLSGPKNFPTADDLFLRERNFFCQLNRPWISTDGYTYSKTRSDSIFYYFIDRKKFKQKQSTSFERQSVKISYYHACVGLQSMFLLLPCCNYQSQTHFSLQFQGRRSEISKINLFFERRYYFIYTSRCLTILTTSRVE